MNDNCWRIIIAAYLFGLPWVSYECFTILFYKWLTNPKLYTIDKQLLNLFDDLDKKLLCILGVSPKELTKLMQKLRSGMDVAASSKQYRGFLSPFISTE